MAIFAIVMNDFVTNIIMADNKATALAVSFPGALAIQCEPNNLVAQGWYYDGNMLMATKPITEIPALG